MASDKPEQLGDLEGSLITTLAESDLAGVAADIAEVSIDVLLDDGVLKDIPVVGIVAKTYSAARTIRIVFSLKDCSAF